MSNVIIVWRSTLIPGTTSQKVGRDSRNLYHLCFFQWIIILRTTARQGHQMIGEGPLGTSTNLVEISHVSLVHSSIAMISILHYIIHWHKRPSTQFANPPAPSPADHQPSISHPTTRRPPHLVPLFTNLLRRSIRFQFGFISNPYARAPRQSSMDSSSRSSARRDAKSAPSFSRAAA